MRESEKIVQIPNRRNLIDVDDVIHLLDDELTFVSSSKDDVISCLTSTSRPDCDRRRTSPRRSRIWAMNRVVVRDTTSTRPIWMSTSCVAVHHPLHTFGCPV